MNWIKRGFSAVRWTYDFIVAQIGIHPDAAFWVFVAAVSYLLVR